MLFFRCFFCIFVALFLLFPAGNAKPPVNYRQIKQSKCWTISVDQRGGGNFTTIQAAIDAVPQSNTYWVCIRIAAGIYKEKVTIPYDKPFIYLVGSGKRETNVVWNGHDSINTSATFTSQADNIMAESLTFINSYNYPLKSKRNAMKAAVAALIAGDKSAFYQVGFIGLQDTLWDVQGKHYFEQCTIQGAVDFIFGSGQSLYERCMISVVAETLNGAGYITAQGRSNSIESNGFVFKDCKIIGKGKTYLGRPWRPYARVVFYNTFMPDIVVPQGWDSWHTNNPLDTITFAELNCRGSGADKTWRVNWANRQSGPELQNLISYSYIDADSWL
ncbi:hypothetical protein CASFOL_028200 [Castilleja foliolosa]|uniref:Pectinesterase n=1 Tax=Castilleja foliolosa TaxID=1961234 RepID=A0ABD3CET1_9LAMI